MPCAFACMAVLSMPTTSKAKAESKLSPEQVDEWVKDGLRLWRSTITSATSMSLVLKTDMTTFDTKQKNGYQRVLTLIELAFGGIVARASKQRRRLPGVTMVLDRMMRVKRLESMRHLKRPLRRAMSHTATRSTKKAPVGENLAPTVESCSASLI